MTNFVIAKGKSPRGAQVIIKTDPYNRIWIHYPKNHHRRLYIGSPVNVLNGFEWIKDLLQKDGFRLEA